MKSLTSIVDAHKWAIIAEMQTEIDTHLNSRIDVNIEVGGAYDCSFPRKTIIKKVSNEGNLFDGKKLMVTFKDTYGNHECEVGRLSLNEIESICSAIMVAVTERRCD